MAIEKSEHTDEERYELNRIHTMIALSDRIKFHMRFNNRDSNSVMYTRKDEKIFRLTIEEIK